MVVAVSMADREERRFAEVSWDSVRLMAESTGVELNDDVAALLAEDVCYRLREAAQVRPRRPVSSLSHPEFVLSQVFTLHTGTHTWVDPCRHEVLLWIRRAALSS